MGLLQLLNASTPEMTPVCRVSLARTGPVATPPSRCGKRVRSVPEDVSLPLVSPHRSACVPLLLISLLQVPWAAAVGFSFISCSVARPPVPHGSWYPGSLWSPESHPQSIYTRASGSHMPTLSGPCPSPQESIQGLSSSAQSHSWPLERTTLCFP